MINNISRVPRILIDNHILHLDLVEQITEKVDIVMIWQRKLVRSSPISAQCCAPYENQLFVICFAMQIN